MSNAGTRKARTSIGLVVEGDTEFYALPKLSRLVVGCPGLQATNLRGLGSHLSATAIAKRALPMVRQHFAAHRSAVVICLDREDREERAEALASEISRYVREEIHQGPVHVVVADRAFEAWLLADAIGLFKAREFIYEPKFGCFEGCLGRGRRKGAAELDHLLGRAYVKTKDGPHLFEKVKFERARDFGPGKRGSRSLDKLLRTLGV
jgi:hypothetical protein